MAGKRGISGPPGNQNAFRHGLASISQRWTNGDLNPSEQSIREKFLVDLFADKSGKADLSIAMRALPEFIVGDAPSPLR